MPFYPGKDAVVTIATVDMSFTDVEMTNNGDIVDVTNFLSGGKYEHVDGPTKLEFSGNGPYKGSAGFKKGDSVTVTVKLTATTPSFTCTALIQDVKISTSVKGAAMIAFSAVSTGSFTVTF